MTLSFRFGTVGSPEATPPNPGGTVGGIKYAASIGLDALELAWVQGVRVSEATCGVIKQASVENGVALSVHAPYYINLNGDEEKWPRLRKYLIDAAHFGNLAGATDIIFHPGTYFGRPPADVLKVTIPRLQGCIDEIRKDGNPVILRPEISGKAAMLGSLSDVLKMAKAIPGVIPCIDFAHLHARLGDGAMNSYD
ncbi:MAG: TIM barrel protein [Anaerolineales bacterium]